MVNIGIILIIFSRFSSLFIINFPLKIVARFWDFILINGLFSAIKIAIALLNYFKKKIFAFNDIEEFTNFFEKLKEIGSKNINEIHILDDEKDYAFDEEKILKYANSIKITKKAISKWASEF